MEKKQVSTFLKILQIPTDAPPAEIKESLLVSGWNEKDADDAIRVLYPDHTSGDLSESSSATLKPQLVAQRYVKPIPKAKAPEQAVEAESKAFVPDTPPPTVPQEPTTEAIETTLPEVPTSEADTVPSSAVPPIQETPERAEADTVPSSAVPPPIPQKSEIESVVESTPPTAEPATEEEFDFASVTKAHAVAAELTATPEDVPTPEEEQQAEQERPHTDAPWLKNQVDIYDVTEEEKQEMIRTVYRTSERLTPQTIHALLGIDVDLSEYEAAYRRRKRNEISGMQIVAILLSSLAIAAIALYFGLYYFEVGPFHPSITGGR